jgi:hypothetical protein
MTTIFVRNNGSNSLTDGFNGVTYNFACGEEVEVPEIAAKHIFGYGDDNKEPYFVRLGWMKMSTDYRMAMERLATFSFSRESSKPVHVSAPVVERVAAPMPKARVAAKGPSLTNE